MTRNNKIRLQKTLYKNKVSLEHYRTRKLKQTIYTSHLFFGSRPCVVVSKKYLTNVKVVLSDNSVYVVLIVCPLYRVTNTQKMVKYCLKKKKTANKFKFNKRAKLKGRKGRRNSFIKKIRSTQSLSS